VTGRRKAWIACAAALAAAMVAPAHAQQISAADAPVAWVRYAEQATATITRWLQADDSAMTRLRAALARANKGSDADALALFVWVDRAGRLIRITAPSVTDPALIHALQSTLIGRPLAGRPPRALHLPLHLRLSIDAGTAEDPAAIPSKGGRQPTKRVAI
jgi:hypothetical protein